MTWTTDKPTAPGWYWVWTPDFPCRGEVCATKVERNKNGSVLSAWVSFMDYDEPVSVIGRDEWIGAQWLGPIEAPAAPGVSR